MGWRALTPLDLPRLAEIAGEVHPGYPERAEVFAERLALAPNGCFAYEAGGEMGGYAIGHPWRGAPPKLDALLGVLPKNADHYYLHDVALSAQARGAGAARAAVDRYLACAQALGLRHLALIAIDGLAPLWGRLGFAPAPCPPGWIKSYGLGALYMRRAAAR
jgi:ribosomal protein S18 acetylase RimI-like enzyme